MNSCILRVHRDFYFPKIKNKSNISLALTLNHITLDKEFILVKIRTTGI